MTLIRAIAASSLKDLTILAFAAMDLDLLIGAKKVKTANFGFVSFEGAPAAAGNYNRARCEGSIEVEEMDEYGVSTLGHDLAFCVRAREAGFRVWAALDCPCSHWEELDLSLVDSIFKRER